MWTTTVHGKTQSIYSKADCSWELIEGDWCKVNIQSKMNHQKASKDFPSALLSLPCYHIFFFFSQPKITVELQNSQWNTVDACRVTRGCEGPSEGCQQVPSCPRGVSLHPSATHGCTSMRRLTQSQLVWQRLKDHGRRKPAEEQPLWLHCQMSKFCTSAVICKAPIAHVNQCC